MARVVLLFLLASVLAAPAWAQSAGQPANPWQVVHEPKPAPSFNLATSSADSPSRTGHGSQLFAGTELMPNGQLGVGAFGEKAERPEDMRATARAYTLPRQPKAAVGFSLKF